MKKIICVLIVITITFTQLLVLSKEELKIVKLFFSSGITEDGEYYYLQSMEDGKSTYRLSDNTQNLIDYQYCVKYGDHSGMKKISNYYVPSFLHLYKDGTAFVNLSRNQILFSCQC